MDKQQWIDRAYDRFVARGVEADEKTYEWAELCWQAEKDNGFELSPEGAIDEELIAAAESQ